MAWCVIPSLLTPYLLDKVDEDGNGTLDLNEFMQASSLLAVVAK